MSKPGVALYIYFLFFPLVFLSQKEQKESFRVGDKVNISVDLYDVAGTPHSIEIPGGAYTLLYYYNWNEKGKDTKDSIKKIEKLISKIVKRYNINDLRVICYSFDKGETYEAWKKHVDKPKPFKEKNTFHTDYYNTNDYKLVVKKLKKLFDKLVLIGADGNTLITSKSIGGFVVEEVQEPVKTILVKGKILTDSVGIKKPLKNTLVCLFKDSKSDTIAKTQTDIYGDFEVPLPDDEKSTYELKVKADDKMQKDLILVSQTGIELSTFEKKTGAFVYRLLKSDVSILSDMEEKEDISLSYKLFLENNKNEFKVIRYLSYGFNKYNIEPPSEDVLKKVIEILEASPAVRLEIISHTDAQGNDAANLQLSQKRSIAVMNYLISKGIDKKRLKAIGKGETQIRNRCKNDVDCSDKEHEYNRRTEFNFIR